MHPRSAFDVTLVVALFVGSILVIAVIGPAHARPTEAASRIDGAIAGESKVIKKLVEMAGDVSCMQQPTASRKFAI